MARSARFAHLRLLATLALLALAFAVTACSRQTATLPAQSGGESATPAEKPAAEKPEEPKATSWVVYINDDDSFSQGGVTYKIALNLTATNPTGDKAGKYTGKATASTSTNGSVGPGAELNAQAIANSSTLQFTLEDPTAGGRLASLTDDEATYKGSGTITMKAAGTASVGAAAGAFSNTSSQKIHVTAHGSKVTLSVVIQGHKYTFYGTISGK